MNLNGHLRSTLELMHPAAKTILLAEEDEEIRERLATELMKEGYHVVEVEDGFELCDYLELLGRWNVRRPDLIVSDVALPGRGGVEVCRMLMRGNSAPPVILLAPHDDEASWDAAERAGAAHVLDKPVDLEKLREAVAIFSDDA